MRDGDVDDRPGIRSKRTGGAQSFRDGVQAAADILEAAIYDPITTNIKMGYGEYDYGGSQYTPLSTYSLGGIISSIDVSYPLLRAALAVTGSWSTEVRAVTALPDSVSLNGHATLYIASAEAKALGVISAAEPAIEDFRVHVRTDTGTNAWL